MSYLSSASIYNKICVPQDMGFILNNKYIGYLIGHHYVRRNIFFLVSVLWSFFFFFFYLQIGEIHVHDKTMDTVSNPKFQRIF